MTWVCVGTIKELSLEGIILEDYRTKVVFNIPSKGNNILSLEKGMTGVFFGEEDQGKKNLTRIELVEFLNPLYEKDLMEVGSKYNLITIVDNPFSEAYLLLKKKQEEIDKQLKLANEESTNNEGPST